MRDTILGLQVLAQRGMRRLATLGGAQGHPLHLNEFGQIAGTSVTGRGAIRAALWTAAVGRLAVAPTDGAPRPKSPECRRLRPSPAEDRQ